MRSDSDDELSACGEIGDQQDRIVGPATAISIRSRVDAPSDKRPFPAVDSDPPEHRDLERATGDSSVFASLASCLSGLLSVPSAQHDWADRLCPDLLESQRSCRTQCAA